MVAGSGPAQGKPSDLLGFRPGEAGADPAYTYGMIKRFMVATGIAVGIAAALITGHPWAALVSLVDDAAFLLVGLAIRAAKVAL